ncbi:MAG: DUF349 domain-containing protein [Casimicrobiaceae bacterium]|nr:DUF349 domain-containing protein [Casimicrobiaceae bacterium]
MLKTLFGATPAWQSPDAATRRAAVAELAPEDAALTELARHDPDASVRAAAMARLRHRETLEAGLADPEASVRLAAARAWVAALGGELEPDTPLAVLAVLLTEEAAPPLREAARSLALARLDELLEIDVPMAAKQAAIERCTDPARLESLYLKWRDRDKRLGKACLERAEALRAAEQTAREADVLITQLEHWLEAAEVPLNKLVEVQRAWAKLAPDAERKARFEALTQRLQRKLQNEALARRLHEQLALKVAGLVLRSKQVAELSSEALAALAAEATEAQGSPVLDAALAQQLQAVHAAVAAELELRERYAEGERLLAERPRQPGPAQEAASSAASDEHAAPAAQDAMTAWQARWEAWLATVDVATRQRFEKRLAALEAPETPKPERPSLPQASAEDVLAANAELAKLAELIAAGEVRAARACASGLFKAFTAKRYPKLEYDRLHELDREVKRLESWLKWSDAQARDALMARVEALKNNPPASIDELVKAIRAAQEEWRALDKKNGGAPKPKWERFNALCREAYAPAQAHFEALKKQRAENAQARTRIIDQMNALAEEAAQALAAGDADWPALEKRKLALFEEWKKAGGVANADWKTLEARFDEAVARLEKSFDAAREPEIARRRRLIALAEEQAKLPPSKAVTEATIALQRRWTQERIANAPHLRRKDEQQLWEAFKRATDAVFKARDQEREAQKAQFLEAAKKRLALIDEVRALASGEDAKSIEQAVAQVRARWREAPPVERERAREFERKFDEAVLAARRRAAQLSRSSLVEAMKATLAQVPAVEVSEATAAALVIDAELIAGLDSPPEIANARRAQQLKWLAERRQLPTAPEAKIQALRTVLGALHATGARLTPGERERLTRAIEAVGAA